MVPRTFLLKKAQEEA